MRIKSIVLFATFLMLSRPSIGQILFEDGFESGNLSETGSVGFDWAGANSTAVVNSNGVLWPNSAGISKPAGESWAAIEGQNSLLFNFPAGETWSEQRFNIGAVLDDLWLGFWLRVPENFTHNSNSPNNNKLLAIWMDDYSSKGDGATVIWEFWHAGSGGSRLAVHYSSGNFRSAGPHLQQTPFISVPEDRGRWMYILVHLRPSSDRVSANGIIEMWRKWDNESVFQKFHEVYDAVIPRPVSGPQGWNAGYLMGWSNPTYDQETNWLLDSFIVTSDRQAGWPESAQEFPPKAPEAY